jgi:hypothetical protein
MWNDALVPYLMWYAGMSLKILMKTTHKTYRESRSPDVN